MTIQTIKINEMVEEPKPTFRLARTPIGSVWQYVGFAVLPVDETNDQAMVQDLNRAVQLAASRLAKKVGGRDVEVEMVIDPLLPPMWIPEKDILPIAEAIAENASASVEPGPGVVVLRTWWNDKHMCVDAIGKNGRIPNEVKKNIMRPGFTTRVADWDTGFGLYQASIDASSFSSQVELLETNSGVGFRLSIPLRPGSPISGPEAMVGLMDLDKENQESEKEKWPLTLMEYMEATCDVCEQTVKA